MSFQVATDAAKSHMIISVGTSAEHSFPPGTSFGASYPIFTIDDDALYAEVLAHRPCYLCADRQSVKPEPCDSA